jgi:hypothetical protein
MKNVRVLIVLFLISLFLTSCSDKKQENPVEPVTEDALTKLLQDAPEDVRAAMLKEIPEDLKKEISKEISNDHYELLKRGRLLIALGQAVSPPPFFDPNGQCAPLLTVNPIIGDGIGTVIGRHTVLQSHCFNPQSLEFTNGAATLTTVQGNHQLFETYYGTLTPTQDPNVLIIRGNSTFVGGTGKFNGTTGSGIAIGTLNITNGETVLLNISTLFTN